MSINDRDGIIKHPKRNDPCWCGSKLKYKKCHLNRESQTPPNIFDMAATAQAGQQRGTCVYPTAQNEVCGATSISSHTVQRKGGLNNIAKRGHVLTLLFTFVDIHKSSGSPRPKKIGLHTASTFPGFCSIHDTNTFKAIEQKTFLLNEETAFLYAYRAIALEAFRKQRNLSDIEPMRSMDKGSPQSVQNAIQNYLRIWGMGIDRGMADIARLKAIYDQKLILKNFSDFHYMCVTFSSILPIVISSSFLFEFDYNGNFLQTLFSHEPCHINFSITSYEDKTICLMSWVGSASGKEIDFLKSFLEIPNDEKAGRLIDTCFVFSENTFLEPDWWGKLAADEQERLLTLYKSGTPQSARSNTDLQKGHTFSSPPKVESIELSSNIAFFLDSCIPR